MTAKAQIILIVIFLIGLIAAVRSVQKKKIQLKYALPWICCMVLLIILVAIPRLIDSLAAWMGIYSPVNLVFFLGFIFLLVIAFTQSRTISKTSSQLRQLTQTIALLEKRLEETRQKDTKK